MTENYVCYRAVPIDSHSGQVHMVEAERVRALGPSRNAMYRSTARVLPGSDEPARGWGDAVATGRVEIIVDAGPPIVQTALLYTAWPNGGQS